MQINNQDAANVHDLTSPAIVILREAGIESPTLEVQLIMAHVLNVNRLHIIAHPERMLSTKEISEFMAAVDSRNKPLSAILYSWDERILWDGAYNKTGSPCAKT